MICMKLYKSNIEFYKVWEVMLIKKKFNKLKMVEKVDEYFDVLYIVSFWNWLFFLNFFYLCLNIVRFISCFNGIWKFVVLKFILEFI